MDISIEPNIELSLVLTAISDLEASARSTQAASEARGYAGPAAITVTRFREVSFLETLQNICIDAHKAGCAALRDAAWAMFDEYRTRPGAVTTDEVFKACAAMRASLES